MADDVDITSDLIDGSDGILGDSAPQNAGVDGTLVLPEGTVPVHARVGDKPVQANDKQIAETPITMREQLSKAFKGEEAPVAEQPKPPAQTVTLTQDAEGKYRLPDGTFASAEQITAFTTANQQQPVVADTLLAGMTPLEQEQFKSLPAELQQHVGRTMEDLTRRQSQYAEYDQLEQALIGPRREAWAANGMNPAVALNQLLALSDFGTRDPGQFVLWFAQQNNLDLDALLDAHEASQAGVDPQVQQLTRTVQQLQQQVQGTFQSQDTQAQQARLQTVQAFQSEKDGAGGPKRPHLPEVMQEWAGQISAIRAQNPTMPDADVLQKAYDNACMINPTVRAKVQEASSVAQQREKAARVAAAKAAGSSVTSAAPVNSSRTADMSQLSLRQQLEAQFAAAE